MNDQNETPEPTEHETPPPPFFERVLGITRDEFTERIEAKPGLDIAIKTTDPEEFKTFIQRFDTWKTPVKGPEAMDRFIIRCTTPINDVTSFKVAPEGSSPGTNPGPGWINLETPEQVAAAELKLSHTEECTVPGVFWPSPDGGIAIINNGQGFAMSWSDLSPETDPDLAYFLEKILERNQRYKLTPPAFSPELSQPAAPTVPTRATDERIINAPEACTMLDLTANYGDRELFTVDPDHMQATFSRPNNNYRAVLDVQSIEVSSWDQLEEVRRTREAAIWAEVDRYTGSRDEGLIAIYVLSRITNSEDGSVRIGFAELLHLEGKTRLGQREREERARELDAVFRLWAAWKPVGVRDWYDPIKRKTRLIHEPAPLLVYQGPFYDQNPLPGMYSYPLGFTFTDSTTTKEYRKDPTRCHAFGVVKALAEIPAGKVAGDWAKSIGMFATAHIRRNAKHSGATGSIKRGTLLTRYAPLNPPEAILRGNNPGRAKQYWKDAISILKDQGILAEVTEPPASGCRKGWAEKWLDETVKVTLAGHWAEAADRILSRTVERQQRTKRVPKTGGTLPKTGGTLPETGGI